MRDVKGQPVVLVLASGRGERFVASGGSGSKLNAMLAGKTVLQRTLDAVRASGLAWHLEDAGHEGMGDSIAAAVGATADAGGWLILPGDLPLVRPDTLRAVAAALADHTVVVPQVQGRRGHPVGFAAECRQALLALRGEHGAAPVARAEAARGELFSLDVADPGIAIDIDTVYDLDEAQRRIAGSS
jgi:molybdenum cofactor cytidylyltransferase